MLAALRLLFYMLLLASGGVAAAAADVEKTAVDESTAAANEEVVTLQMDFYFGDLKISDTVDTLKINRSNNTYEFDSYSDAVGLAEVLYGDVHINARGVLDSVHGVRMTAYKEKRGRKREQQASVQDEVLLLQRDDETREESVSSEQPTFDVLSALYRSFVLQRPAFGKFRFTDGWRLRDYEYTDGGEESIASPLAEGGELNTIRLLRIKKDGSRRTIWLSKQHDYLPVQVLIQNKKSTFRLITKAVINS